MEYYDPVINQISNKSLQALFNKMKIAKVDLDMSLFFKQWEGIINNLPEKNILFYDKTLIDNTFYQVFPIEHIFDDVSITITFDIGRIIKFIETKNINPSLLKSSDVKNDFYYFPEINNSQFSQSLDPFMVYLPVMEGVQYKRYAVIDGNHRITEAVRNNKTFNFYGLSPSDLKPSCFSNLNSFLAYHLLVGFYSCTSQQTSVLQYILSDFVVVANSLFDL